MCWQLGASACDQCCWNRIKPLIISWFNSIWLLRQRTRIFSFSHSVIELMFSVFVELSGITNTKLKWQNNYASSACQRLIRVQRESDKETSSKVKTVTLCFYINKWLHLILYAMLLYVRLWRNLCAFTLSATSSHKVLWHSDINQVFLDDWRLRQLLFDQALWRRPMSSSSAAPAAPVYKFGPVCLESSA